MFVVVPSHDEGVSDAAKVEGSNQRLQKVETQ